MPRHCLLLHGLGGRDAEMNTIAAKLAEAQFTPHSILLPGHGRGVEEYEKSRFEDWIGLAEKEYLRLASADGKVMLAGFSLGGLLALWLAEKHKPAGAAILASPLRLVNYYPFFSADWRIFFLSILGRTLKKVDVTPLPPEARAIAPWQGHDAIFPPQLLNMARNAKNIEKNLHKITCPLLLMQDYNDHTCNKWNTWRIASRCSSKDVTIKLSRIQNKKAGCHMIVTHMETRDFVAEEVTDFARKTL